MSSSWTCQACTFENTNNSRDSCSMCCTKRKVRANNNNNNNNAASSKKTVQRTLLGAIAVQPEKSKSQALPPPKKNAASRKRKAPPSSSQTCNKNDVSSTFATKAHHNFKFSLKCQRNSPILASPSSRQEATQNVLTQVFGLSKLRPLQEQSIATSLQGKNQLIVLATGGGKSLCYQLPACLVGGVTIVISPLIALMQDQVLALQTKFKIPAACISSSQTESKNKQILEYLAKGDPKNSPTLLYITPESIQTDRMRRLLKDLAAKDRLAMFAVDEAHCLSSWGHDFRPAYRKLSWLRSEFPKIQCMACTATATPQVIQDIQTILKLQKAPLHKGSFDRPNIFYKVKYKDAFTSHMKTALQDLVDYIQKRHADDGNEDSKQQQPHCSGIVYVHKRDDTNLITRALQKAGIRAAAYHAGLKDAQRNQVQHDWSNNTIQVAVATVAFGMGIDLAHVRYVIHWTLPKTLEGFYQESGRAGRDGLPSHSILYYSQDDARKFQWLVSQQSNNSKKAKEDPKAARRQQEQKLKSLEQMVDYCTKPTCRRNALIKHFGGTPVDCQGTCDYCVDPKKVERAVQSAAVLASDGRYGGGGKIYHSSSGGGGDEWNGQWNGMHDEDDEEGIARDWGDGSTVVDGLRITGPADGVEEVNFDEPRKRRKAGFTTAASVLAKYEVLECRENNGRSNGFVKFRSKSSSDNYAKEAIPVPTLQIPEHLRVQAKPTSATAKKKAPEPTSADHAAAAKKLQDEIAQLNAQREERMKVLMARMKKKKSHLSK